MTARGNIERELPLGLAQKIFDYDKKSGALIWRKRPLQHFKNQHICNSWNAKHAGRVAGSANTNGYIQVKVNRRLYKVHRIIWLLETGEWPNQDIDHISGVRADNRFANLRSVSRSENCKNKKNPTTNTSGVIGVGWHKVTGKWRARIMSEGRSVNLGLFDDIRGAIAARKSAEMELGFHRNHGRHK